MDSSQVVDDIPHTNSSHLKICNRICTRLHPRGHIPILDQTRSNHPPDACDIALPERNTVASKVDSAEGRASQVGAHKHALNFN